MAKESNFLPPELRTEVEVIYGACEGGTFIALHHTPTGVRVSDGPLKGRKVHTVLKQLGKELIDTINARKSKKQVRS